VVQDGSLLSTINQCHATSQKSEDFKFAYVQEMVKLIAPMCHYYFKNLTDATFSEGNEDFVQRMGA
jgi:hypothetical protein